MGKTEKRELTGRLTVLLLHLLKWAHQPHLRGNSWRLSIANARDDILDVLDDNPSLKPQLGAILEKADRHARRSAVAETDLPDGVFATTCPWRFEQAVDEAFWPA